MRKRRSYIIHYSYKQWRCWVEISIFFGPICFMKSDFFKIIFQIFMCLFTFRKTDQRKIFFSKRKFGLVFRKVLFFLFWTENTFHKLWKIQKYLVICWLYQISSSIFWLIYILFWIFFFQFHPFELDLIWFLYQFWFSYFLLLFAFLLLFYLLKIFIYYIFSIFFWLLFIFIWNNLWNCIF